MSVSVLSHNPACISSDPSLPVKVPLPDGRRRLTAPGPDPAGARHRRGPGRRKRASTTEKNRYQIAGSPLALQRRSHTHDWIIFRKAVSAVGGHHRQQPAMARIPLTGVLHTSSGDRRKSLATRAQEHKDRLVEEKQRIFSQLRQPRRRVAALFSGSVKEAVLQRLEKEPKTIPFKTPSRPTPLEESRKTQRQERAGSGPDKDSARVRTRLQRPFFRQFTGRQQTHQPKCSAGVNPGQGYRDGERTPHQAPSALIPKRNK